MTDIYPRVLVVSNNSFSKTSNNGRTMANMFSGWPKENLAQFCISTTEPDYEVCDNYYLLTDNSVLKAFTHFQKGRRCEIEVNIGTEGNTYIRGKKAKKTPFRMLLRQIVWSGSRWKSNEFKQWVNAYNPEIVFVWNSDAFFILDIATYVAKTYQIPIVLFNTEGFYLFEKNIYDADRWLTESIYRLFHCIYKLHFKTMMKYVSLSIHLNSLLRDEYHHAFKGKDIVLYTGSNLSFDSSNLHLESPQFSYLGNLMFKRHEALIEISEVLQQIKTSYRLDVYGQASTPQIEAELKACPSINYHGMVPYEKVIEVIYNSTILFHAETHDDKYSYYLRYGFSTKIADSISSGHPFLMYSPAGIAGAKYIEETGAAWLAKDKIELKDKIITILNNDKERERVLKIAKQIAMSNHSAKKNTLIFQEELLKLVE